MPDSSPHNLPRSVSHNSSRTSASSSRAPYRMVCKESGLCCKVVQGNFATFRHVDNLNATKARMGGPGKIMCIDGTIWTKRKFKHGRLTAGHKACFLGAIEFGQHTRKETGN